MAIKMDLAKYIQSARKAQGLKVTELAKRLGISKSHLSEIESGIKQPSYKLVRKIYKLLDNPEILHVYFRRTFPEIENLYKEAVLQSEAKGMLKGRVISQVLSQNIMDMFLNNSSGKKSAENTLKNIYLHAKPSPSLKKELSTILGKLKALHNKIEKDFTK